VAFLKKTAILLMLLFFNVLLISCNSVKLPKIDESDYDISKVVEPLNEKLDEGTDFNLDDFVTEIGIYLGQYSVITEDNEVTLISYGVADIAIAKDKEEMGIDIWLYINFPKTEASEVTYDELEFLFLQMLVDLEENTKYPISLDIEFGFTDYKFAFKANIGVDKEHDGLSKFIVFYGIMSKDEFESDKLDIFMGSNYTEYFQKTIGVSYQFTSGAFTVHMYPKSKEYQVLSETDMSMDTIMADYLSGYNSLTGE
jgi:hypothetical protein